MLLGTYIIINQQQSSYQLPGTGQVGYKWLIINGRSPGSNTWRYVNVPYVWPYFVVIFTLGLI